MTAAMAPPTPPQPPKHPKIPPKQPPPPSPLERALEDRDAFVAEACTGDAALHAEVRALLASHREAGDLVEDYPSSPEIEAELARLKPEEEGERIGPCKLREQVGEVGFGTVWVADQEVPVRRRVALKILKLGMDTKEVIARFEQERQALAMMDHPNIARMLDAGATPTRQYVSPFWRAWVWAYLNEKDRALSELERGLVDRDVFCLNMKTDPILDSLRGEPRFQAVLKKVGFPE
jgi:hypothetical protein